MKNPLNSYFCVAQPFSRHHHYYRKVNSYFEHTGRFYYCSSHRLTIKNSMILHFWYHHIIKVFQLNSTIILQFRHLFLCMDQLTRFVDNPSYSFGEFPMQLPLEVWLLDSIVSIFVQLLLPRLSFQKDSLNFFLRIKSLVL